ncbi:MAG: glycine oxidase ThiO [Kiloniellales bacterium]
MTIIVGGGICGLGIGWYLARAGHPVTVLERGQAGSGATWASAGMLAPRAEAEPAEERLIRLVLEGHALWPEFVAELEAASGIEVDYRSEGTIVVALDRDDAERLRFQYDFQQGLGLETEWLSGYAARECEPHLAREVTAAILSPHDHQVDNRKVALALRAALVRAGGTLKEHTEVTEVVVAGGRVSGVRAGDAELGSDTVVVAAGAWSRDLPGLPAEVRPPVRPVKGQTLALMMDRAAPLIERVVWGPNVYLVPRRDGRLICGATVEEAGFDTSLTGGGLMDVLRHAWEVVPGIYDLPLVESWAGLRPTSRDDAPILGQSSVPGLVFATGHHRNGILLGPLTAQAVGELILSGEMPAYARPFGPGRFAAAGAEAAP